MHTTAIFSDITQVDSKKCLLDFSIKYEKNHCSCNNHSVC